MSFRISGKADLLFVYRSLLYRESRLMHSARSDATCSDLTMV